MVSYEQWDAVDVVRQGLLERRADERMSASATVLAERLDRIHRLGGVFAQISFSPQMQAVLSRQPAETAECAV